MNIDTESTNVGGGSSNSGNTTTPQSGQPQDKQYKNIETSVGKREDFDEDFAVGEEDKISNGEAGSDKSDLEGA